MKFYLIPLFVSVSLFAQTNFNLGKTCVATFTRTDHHPGTKYSPRVFIKTNDGKLIVQIDSVANRAEIMASLVTSGICKYPIESNL